MKTNQIYQRGLARGASVLCGCLLGWGGLQPAAGTERLFTYSYEPETMPQGALEFEQWITLRTQRTTGGSVGRENFNRWQFREELEYGVTDRYTVGLYLNTQAESYRNVRTGTDVSDFKFDGISLENRYLVLNPAEYPVGLTLYLEPTFSGEEAEVEQKIILGQRHGKWKWAVNLIHATEWEDNLHEMKGEVEVTAGLTRLMGKHWALGLEARNHNELPEYERWDNTALFVGPVVSYFQEKWWVTLTVLPQIWGENFRGNPDANRWLDLARHERLNVRLLFGIMF